MALVKILDDGETTNRRSKVCLAFIGCSFLAAVVIIVGLYILTTPNLFSTRPTKFPTNDSATPTTLTTQEIYNIYSSPAAVTTQTPHLSTITDVATGYSTDSAGTTTEPTNDSATPTTPTTQEIYDIYSSPAAVTSRTTPLSTITDAAYSSPAVVTSQTTHLSTITDVATRNSTASTEATTEPTNDSATPTTPTTQEIYNIYSSPAVVTLRTTPLSTITDAANGNSSASTETITEPTNDSATSTTPTTQEIYNIYSSPAAVTSETTQLSTITDAATGDYTASARTTTEPAGRQLPHDTTPLHYSIKLRPNFYNDDIESFYTSGKVEIELNCTKKTKTIVMHAKDLVIVNIQLLSKSGKNVKVLNHAIDKDLERLTVTLAEYLDINKQYIISIIFTAELKTGYTKKGGLYITGWDEIRDKKRKYRRYIASTHMQPTHARMAFPCYDEPGLKATFDVILERKDFMISASNQELDFTTNTSEMGWKADHFKRTPLMSTCLVAIVIAEWQNVSDNYNGIQLFVFFHPGGGDATKARNLIRQTKNELKHFEDKFNSSYSLPKLDQVVVPWFWYYGAGNWGLITYKDAGIPAAGDTHIVKHEIAHQWFGNLVTMEWWDDIWLNEGFAGYFASRFGYPFMVQRSLKYDNVYRFPVHLPKELDERDVIDHWQVSGIVFPKAVCLIHMMSNFLGKHAFIRGIRHYLKSNAYKAVTRNHLWSSMNKKAIEDGMDLNNLTVAEIMDTWVLQSGYPVLHVERNYVKGAIEITQSPFYRYTLNKDPPASPFNYTWTIPVTFTTKKQSFNNPILMWFNKDETLLTIPAQFVPSKDEWFLVNIRNDYYRVNYDNRNWELLTQQIKQNATVIPQNNVRQVACDAKEISKSMHKILNHTVVKELLEITKANEMC